MPRNWGKSLPPSPPLSISLSLFSFSLQPFLSPKFRTTATLFYWTKNSSLFYNVVRIFDLPIYILVKYLTFVRSNNYRQGFNSISNRLRSVSNMIEMSWPTLARETFKLKCKINIIQAGLLLL